MKSQSKTSKTRWHRILGRLFKELLAPTGILVYTDIPVMGESPEADILLLRKNQKQWTKEQKSRLPDGIRDSRQHISSLNSNILNLLTKKS
ncbi:hypothetical protein QUF70_01265 [Desulfobacterales bacterium HSG17]|nr:hypothetical protein [Desulfobacterales bacterium HSG17]